MLDSSRPQECELQLSAYILSALIRQSANETNEIDCAIKRVNVQIKLELHQYQGEINPDDKPTGDRKPYLPRGPLQKHVKAN
jgi:hypothetical protein